MCCAARLPALNRERRSSLTSSAKEGGANGNHVMRDNPGAETPPGLPFSPINPPGRRPGPDEGVSVFFLRIFLGCRPPQMRADYRKRNP